MVYFVGAGSGAPDLITVRGERLLKEADVVIYAGSLVNPALLSVCKEETEIYDSAKMTLEEVIDVIKEAEKSGRMTVRLHTGDPSIYGAIREQMDALKACGISWEVCPGVSSMSAAAAALSLEYTLPGVSQTVIVSRIAGRTPVPEKEELAKLAAIGATLVLFLSSGYTKEVREELLKGAYTEETKCALVYKASWPEQKVVRTTLGALPEAAEEAGINKTALIIVGDVLGDDYELSKLYDAHFSTGYRDAKD
ncbi:MAG: precorrin-4 C(11)-methyltransferase [Lachnospiraceae bacterium]|nr:precorrin-4 C(11)-methyltransferase [Lachnospiraceae bacterium]